MLSRTNETIQYSNMSLLLAKLGLFRPAGSTRCADCTLHIGTTVHGVFTIYLTCSRCMPAEDSDFRPPLPLKQSSQGNVAGMTEGDAAHVRDIWDRSGRPRCEHPLAALEQRADRQHFTGRYICMTCGLIYEKGACPQPSTPSSCGVEDPDETVKRVE